MKSKCICLFFVLSIGVLVYGQTLRRPANIPYISLGSYSVNYADILSFITNQASLAQIKKPAIAVFGEKRFLLSELNNFITGIAIPTTSGNFGIKVGYYGFTEYNETQLGLAYGRRLGSKIDIGVQINYNGIRIAGYGNDAAIGFEIGTVFHLTEKIHTGVHVSNPVGGKFGKDQQEKLSSIYTIGIGYEVSEKVFIGAEVVKEEDLPVNVNTGIQYKILPQLSGKMGISSGTSSGWIGVGLSWRSFHMDITSAFHPHLGVTPGLFFLFTIDNKEN